MPAPLPVILDTDPGVDDALALLLAAASPELDVLAITTVGGNVSLDQATENARRIVPIAWHGRVPPPIHRGTSAGLETAEYVHGFDGLGGVSAMMGEGGIETFPVGVQLAHRGATEAMLSLVRQHPEQITVVTLGPLTNVAAAFQQEPEAMRGVREVVIMGGAFRETGNTSPVAEFNIFADPEAAQVVCESGMRLRWVPLDVTQRCLLRPEHLERLSESPRLRFAQAIASFYMGYHLRGYGEQACFLHDPVAVAAVIWPELFRSEPMRVDVEPFGALTRGMTVADFRRTANRTAAVPNSSVTLGVDTERLLNRLIPRLA